MMCDLLFYDMDSCILLSVEGSAVFLLQRDIFRSVRYYMAITALI